METGSDTGTPHTEQTKCMTKSSNTVLQEMFR